VALGERHEEFKKRGAEVVGVSCDSVHSHKAWVERGDLKGVNYPLLGDFTKQISRDYGVLDDEKGLSHRGTFLIDPNGVVQFQVISALGVGRSVDEMLRTLDALQTGELCPANWKPGQKTLSKK
jgi:peroxiredoxin 2/4